MAGTRITIVGAGLAGPLLAIYLAREESEVSLYERRPDPRIHGFAGGRSINLALSARGIDGLARVGLADEVLKTVIPMRGRMLHEPNGRIAFQYYSSNHTDAINSVARAHLNLILLNAAERSGAKLVFDHRAKSLDLERDQPTVSFDNGVTIETDLVVGADGAYSVVRQQMQKREGFNFSQEYLEHGYKELTIPPTASGDFAMNSNALHIWPRGGYMMIGLPNQDRSFTCTCFWPFAGPHGFESLQTDEQIVGYFKQNFPDAVPLMPTLVADYKSNPTSSLVTVRCHPWHWQDKVVLIGDAAHAIVPFYGQGMNAAFEDCVTLTECLREFGPDCSKALSEFTARRKPHTDAIADMALHNFVEMRDHVASPAFLMKKKLEHALHRFFPGTFVPLYNMISFSTIPYAEARERAAEQARMLSFAGLAVAAGLIGLCVTVILMMR
jgi:kynurenine 3-monooxygenase